MRKIFFVSGLSLLLLFNSLPPLSAAVPHLVRYQGYAADSQDVALEGQYNLTFRIYDAPTIGNKLWEETQNSVPVTKGNFSVLLGQITPLNLTFDRDCWMAIQINNDAEMAPRQRISSVPFAIRAEKLDNAENMSPLNIAKNGSFESWSNGVSSSPDIWILSGTGAAAAQSSIRKLGAYSVNQTSGGGESRLIQSIDNPTDYANNEITLLMWVKCNTPNSARIMINDGTTPVYSSYHTGGGQWEPLSVTKPLLASVPSITIGTAVAAGKNAQFDGATLVKGNQVWGYNANTEAFDGAVKGDMLYFDSGWKKLPKSNEKRAIVMNSSGLPVWGSAVTQASAADDTSTNAGNQWTDKLTVSRNLSPGSTLLVIATFNTTISSFLNIPGSGNYRLMYGSGTVIQEAQSSVLGTDSKTLIGLVSGVSGLQTIKLQFKTGNVSTVSMSNAKLTVLEF